MAASLVSRCRHLGFEPGEGSLEDVALVHWVCEAMAFVGVDDELGLDAFGAEGVPELEALGSRAFAVTVSYYD